MADKDRYCPSCLIDLPKNTSAYERGLCDECYALKRGLSLPNDYSQKLQQINIGLSKKLFKKFNLLWIPVITCLLAMFDLPSDFMKMVQLPHQFVATKVASLKGIICRWKVVCFYQHTLAI
jgi:hypothetical protein